MEQPLELSIVLTDPPQGCQPEVLANITLQCEALGLSHTGSVLTDPLKQRERDDLHWYLEEYWKWPYEQFLTRGRHIEDFLADLGEQLYGMVFGVVQAEEVVKHWQKQSTVQHQISIVSEIPRVLSLPWELLHDTQGFLALRPDHPISIVRRLPQYEPSPLSTSFEPPLRVLLVTARPEGTGFIDPRDIARELVDEVQTQVEEGIIELEFLRPPTLSALRTRLRDRERSQVHVFHFDGHGVFNEGKDGQGVLFFETSGGRVSPVKASDLAKVLRDTGIRLAVLTACQSAMSATDDAFSSVAAQLIQGGIDAVAAMSASVLVASATRYVEAFYHALSAGTSALMAQEQARRALHDDPHRHLLRRRRDEEGKPVEMHDWWLPHFYQQRPVSLQPGEVRHKHINIQQTPPLRRLSEEMPSEPRYGFGGRTRELFQVERSLLLGKLVVISGFGGVGKTALAREAADWLTRTQMYDGACFVSFEHGGSFATLLSTLGMFLGIYDGYYNPADKKIALARLGPALKGKRTLVIVDNVEGLLPGGGAPLETAIATELWDVLLELTRLDAGVLVTSRNTTFGDSRLTTSSQVAHLPLNGLYPEDAYTLACRLLDELKIDRRHAPYAELRDLLAQLDYLPSAIQLVLPALRNLPLATIKANFAALLPTFVDDTSTGHNRSLVASLDYSLRELSEEDRVLLSRLAIFEGGAREVDLLAITEIPETRWLTLRSLLERGALLTVERVHQGVTDLFLRFHPILIPFLRNQFGVDDAELSTRYSVHYAVLAAQLYDSDDTYPQAIRAVVLRELPNLRHAWEILLERGEVKGASVVMVLIGQFLEYFGMASERDVMQEKTAEAQGALKGEEFTEMEWINQWDLGNSELKRGNISAAITRFTTMLAHITAQSQGVRISPGSYYHCRTLRSLAQCLNAVEQFTAAEEKIREALALIVTLVEQPNDGRGIERERGRLFGDLGDILLNQGRYLQAREAYEQALQIATQLGNLQEQGIACNRLGIVTLKQEDYSEARQYFLKTLDFFHMLREPTEEAKAWHNLGVIAEQQKDLPEAERCYRESLILKEQLGDIPSIVSTCHQLANLAKDSGRPAEAEGWWMRALELVNQVQHGSSVHAGILTSLAELLVEEISAGRISNTRLIEAQGYAEQAQAIFETLAISENTWIPLGTLARIADLEGLTEMARSYRQREREIYATFDGHRSKVDQRFGSSAVAIADSFIAAAQGDIQMQGVIDKILTDIGAKNTPFRNALQRIVAGERDWHLLAEEFDLDAPEALRVLRLLETIEERETQNRTWEQIITSSLPTSILEVLQNGDHIALEQALRTLSPEEWRILNTLPRVLDQAYKALSPEKQRIVEELMHDLRVQQGEEGEPLLYAIAEVAIGDDTQQREIEVKLADLEKQGWQFREAVQRIWGGERDIATLTEGLDETNSAVVHRVLEILAQLTNVKTITLEQLVSMLPSIIREAMEQGDVGAFERAFNALPLKEQQKMKGLLQYLRARAQFEPLLHAIAAVAIGDTSQRSKIEEELTYLEEVDWHLKGVVQRLWAGERDLAILIEGLSDAEIEHVQRVLEILAQPTEAQDRTSKLMQRVLEITAQLTEAQQVVPEQLILSLPSNIREAMERGDMTAVQQALAALPMEEQQVVIETISSLQALYEETEESDSVSRDTVIQDFEPLLQAITTVATGNPVQRSEIEAELADLETEGWHLRQVVHRIWAGDRDVTALTEGLDEQETVLVQRLLEIIAGA